MKRQDAIELGLKRYMPDNLCRNGHIAERKTNSNQCVACNLEATRRYGSKRQKRDQSEYKKGWDALNKEKLKSYQVFRNREKLISKNVRKRAAMRDCTPKWLSTLQRNEMRRIYDLAKDVMVISGQKYDVDHIIPINGENVCGLHVPWNLQILPSDINRSKRNKMEE